MKQEFITAVNDSDLAKVRISLSNELLLDPRGATFSEMLRYAQERLPDLFEENHVSDYSVPPQEKWDKSFLFKVKNDLDSNFSKEKLAFYEAVIKAVGKSKANEIDHQKNQRYKETYNNIVMPSRKKSQRTSSINKTYVTVSAGGTILALIGIAAEQTLLTVLGGTALVVGGVLLINNHMQKR